MCSIEEAWAGQTFDGYRVQSQADLRRKYMPISDEMLTRNNEFTVSKKEPVSRIGNQGINTKIVRPLRVGSSLPNAMQLDNANTTMNVSFSANQPMMDNYSGLEPRPGYMSIYDNAGNEFPMPIQTQQASRNGFSDINQAFQVNPVVERFIDNNSNPLLNEDTNDDQLVLYKKSNVVESNNDNNKKNADNQVIQNQLSQLKTSVQNILTRLERVEKDLHYNASRNMYDMVLYILVGMLIAFILYSFLRK